jgi:hypothetical protein
MIGGFNNLDEDEEEEERGVQKKKGEEGAGKGRELSP